MWDSGMEFVNCDAGKGKDFKVEIMPRAKAKIDLLMKHREHIEWLAFLMGEIQWDKNYAVVTDLYIPDAQDNTVGDVENINCSDEVRKQIIGVIHSHHSMGCFFSRDDFEFLNKNHNISIVVSNLHKKTKTIGPTYYLISIRKKLECGRYELIETDKVYFPSNGLSHTEISDFIEMIDDHISTGIGEFTPDDHGRFVTM